MSYTSNPYIAKVRRDAVHLVKYEGWSMRKVARRFGVEPSTISRWCRHVCGTGTHPIPTRTSRPHSSPNALPKEIVEAILKKRIGRRRCGQHIHHELVQEGVEVSLSSVHRTLDRLGLTKKRSPWKRPHDFTERPEATYPGALLEVDTVHIMLPDGSRLYVYTMIDLYSRWAYAEIAKKISAGGSVKFVMNARKRARFKFKMIQTDNGPEFQKMFRYRLNKQKLLHRHSRVRKSNDQAHIERFNRTIQEECLDLTSNNLRDMRKALKVYLPYYNNHRSHMGINFKTPRQLLTESVAKVLIT